MNLPTHQSLSDLLSEIDKTLKHGLEPTYWIVAEISDCNVNYKGHCYLELIEKPEDSDYIEAKQRAVIWARKYEMISSYFESVTGTSLQKGLRILCRVSVEFHAVYGLSLHIVDIEPVYTVGEDEKRRQEILQRLYEEGIVEMNKEIMLPDSIQNIAIISSPNAAGYQDFIQQLSSNSYGLQFYTVLFSASMQGAEVEPSVTAALDAIYKHEEVFDAVVIIRGGGAQTDLRWFDSYVLAAHVAQFPLPVISGIGHDKDMSIIDIVAHTSLKTPTAVADYIIEYAADVLFQCNDLQNRLHETVHQYISEERRNLTQLHHDLAHRTQSLVTDYDFDLRNFAQNVSAYSKQSLYKALSACNKYSYELQSATKSMLTHEKDKVSSLRQQCAYNFKTSLGNNFHALEILSSRIQSYNPEHILKQGYTLTHNEKGSRIVYAAKLKQGDV
ncbi:MAG: exodeoxyribonuclease VII large subunit, partial [Bacteroidota bacterium]